MKGRVLTMLCLPAILVWAVAAHGAEIDVSGPTEAEPGQLVMFTVSGVSATELPDCRLVHWPAEGVSVIPATTWAGQPFVLFTASEPGTYVLVVFLQRPGGGYVGHGITVGPQPGPGPDPGPNPDPSPGPQRLSLVLVIEESSERTPEQAAVLTNGPLREWMLKQNLSFRLLDKDLEGTAPAVFVRYFRAAAEGGTYPVVFLVGDDASVISQGALPATVDEFKARIGSLLKE